MTNALDVVLAVLCLGALAFAVAILVRSRGGRTVRVAGRAVSRPRVWATGVICLSVASLLRLGRVAEILPDSWRPTVRAADLVLTGVFVVLFLVHGVSRRRSRN